MDDITSLYRQVETPELVQRFAQALNAARVIPDPAGKHLLTLQSRSSDQVEADVTVKTREGASIIYVWMDTDVWENLPKLPDDFLGEEIGEDDDDE